MHRLHLAVLIGALTLLLAPFAEGASTGVVVSQIYAGGGNSGATYTNDFVELLNTGSAAAYEGAGAAPALSNTTAAVRAGAGCTDTGANAADFAAVAPAPRNSASPATACAAAPAGGTGAEAAVAADLEPLISISGSRS